MTPKITKHWIVLSKHGKNLMGWKLPVCPNEAEKTLEPNSHGCDLLQQLDKDKKKKKIPYCSNQFGWDPRPACCFAIHEGLSVSNANLSLFLPRISKRHASILKKKMTPVGWKEATGCSPNSSNSGKYTGGFRCVLEPATNLAVNQCISCWNRR